MNDFMPLKKLRKREPMLYEVEAGIVQRPKDRIHEAEIKEIPVDAVYKKPVFRRRYRSKSDFFDVYCAATKYLDGHPERVIEVDTKRRFVYIKKNSNEAV